MATFTVMKELRPSYDKPPRREAGPIGREYLTYDPPTLTEEEFECLPDAPPSRYRISVKPCSSGFLKVPVTVTYIANNEKLTFGIGAQIEIRRNGLTNQIVLLVDDGGMPEYIKGYGPSAPTAQIESVIDSVTAPTATSVSRVRMNVGKWLMKNDRIRKDPTLRERLYGEKTGGSRKHRTRKHKSRRTRKHKSRKSRRHSSK